jgi:hypothetical protein
MFLKVGQDQNAWGGGSAGSTKINKATKVIALNGVLCQVENHDCQGVYMCDKLDSSILDDHDGMSPTRMICASYLRLNEL